MAGLIGSVAQLACVLSITVRSIPSLVSLPAVVVSDVALRAGLRITPDHPFLHNGQWQLPRAVYPVQQMTLDAVYNFELEEGGDSCWVNAVLVVTLGQRTIRATDPAYSEWADAQWGWGWQGNPERARYAHMGAQHTKEE